MASSLKEIVAINAVLTACIAAIVTLASLAVEHADDVPRDLIARCHGCNLTGLNLHGRDLHGLFFVGAKLQGTDLRNCDLRDAKFTESDLRNVKLDGANLSNVRIVGPNMDGATFNGAVLLNLQLVGMRFTVTRDELLDLAHAQFDGARIDAGRCACLRSRSEVEMSFR